MSPLQKYVSKPNEIEPRETSASTSWAIVNNFLPRPNSFIPVTPIWCTTSWTCVNSFLAFFSCFIWISLTFAFTHWIIWRCPFWFRKPYFHIAYFWTSCVLHSWLWGIVYFFQVFQNVFLLFDNITSHRQCNCDSTFIFFRSMFLRSAQECFSSSCHALNPDSTCIFATLHCCLFL